jgi:hypothetical protein
VTGTRPPASLARQRGSCRLPPSGNPAPLPQGVAALCAYPARTGPFPVSRDTVTVRALCSPRKPTGVMQIASLGQSGPAAPTRGGAVLRQTFGVRVSWTCCCSASGPARHRAECTASGLPSGKTTVVVHPLSISAQVAWPLKACLKWRAAPVWRTYGPDRCQSRRGHLSACRDGP